MNDLQTSIAGLLKALSEAPNDAALRLILADAWEDQGQQRLAMALRWSVEHEYLLDDYGAEVWTWSVHPGLMMGFFTKHRSPMSLENAFLRLACCLEDMENYRDRYQP